MSCKWVAIAEAFMRAEPHGLAAHYECNRLIAHLRSGHSRRRQYGATRNALRAYRAEVAAELNADLARWTEICRRGSRC